MQLTGQLVYHESQADLDEDVAWYDANGRSYEEESRSRLEMLETRGFHRLPEDLREGVGRYAASRKLPPEEFLNRVNGWRREIRKKWEARTKDYVHHYRNIKEKLPASVLRVTDRAGLHDARISGIDTDGGALAIRLDCGGAYSFDGEAVLRFRGIRSCAYPEDRLNGGCWLDSEVYLREDGCFEMIGLIDVGFVEIEELVVVAEELVIEALQAR